MLAKIIFYTTTSYPTFVSDIFKSSKLALTGGPVRRSIASVERFTTLPVLLAAVRARGWVVMRNDRYWVFCHASKAIRQVVGVTPSGKAILAP